MSKYDDVFRDYPSAKQLWEAADGALFLDEESAKKHAVSLKDSRIEKVKRDVTKSKDNI